MFRVLKYVIPFLFLSNMLLGQNIAIDTSRKDMVSSKIFYHDECLALIDSAKAVLDKDLIRAKTLASEAIGLASKIKEDTLALESAKLLTVSFLNLKEQDSTLKYGDIALFYAKKVKNYVDEAAIESLIAKCYIDCANYQKANQHLTKSEEIYVKLNRKKIHKNYLFFKLSKANFFYKMELIDLAFKEFYEMEKIADSVNYPEYLMQIYGGIAVLYAIIGDYDMAIQYNIKSLSEIISGNSDKALIYSNIGGIYVLKEQFDKAQHYYDKARLCYLNLNASLYDINHISLSEIQMYINAKNINKAKLILESLDTNYLLVGQKPSYYRLQFLLEENINEKIKLVKKGLKYSIKAKDLLNVRKCYETLYEIYKTKGQYKLAFENLEHYNIINDSLNNEDKNLAIQKVIVQSMEDKKNQKIKENKLIYNNRIINESRKFWFVFSLSLGLFLIVVFLYQLYRFSSKKSRFISVKNQLLEAENKQTKSDLEKISFEWKKSKDFLKKTKKELREIQFSNDKHTKINSLLAITNQFVASEEKKINLQEKIKKIQDSFFSKLDELVELTPKDKKLAALLSIDLTSKEIATTLNVSEKTIESYRSRLRKKLNIPLEISLNDYFKEMT